MQTKIIQLMQKVPNKFFVGRNPRTCIAGLIYYVCKNTPEKRLQEEVADALLITVVSLRSRMKEIIVYFGNPN